MSRNSIIRDTTKQIMKQILDDVEGKCRAFCDELCMKAVYYRNLQPKAHNFTGNFLNSIVVCLYRKKKLVYVSATDGKIRAAIQEMMTRPYYYEFDVDYEGGPSEYGAEIETGGGYGWQRAMEFVQTYSPKGKNLFDIVVAYTAEYADFIERERQSTGILESYANTEKVAVKWLQLPQA